MTNRSLAALLIVAVLASGCAGAAAPTIRTESPMVITAADNINPEVTPPTAQIKVAEYLPVVEAPSGFITQAAARDMAVAAMQQRQWGGVFLLTELRFDTANQEWVAEFQTDGRIPGRPRSHPQQVLSDDPIEQRKLEQSWVSVATHLHLVLDGVTGEVRGGGFRGGNVQPDRPDLEHYRGVIVTGGEVLRLRLTKADGTPAGRDIEVWVPKDSLGADLSLWQLQYGQGRTVEVWGLTGSPGMVLAHRITMADPPPESLLAVLLTKGLPLFPGAYIRPTDDNTIVLEAKDADLPTVRAWYNENLPAYGWVRTNVADTFETAAQEMVRMSLVTQDDVVKVTFTQIKSPAADTGTVSLPSIASNQGLAPMPRPPAQADGQRVLAEAQYQQCGEETNVIVYRQGYQGYDAEARDCLWRGYRAGEPTEFISTSFTKEGDPITYHVRVVSRDDVWVLVDSKDTFGAEGQFDYSCKSMERGDPRFAHPIDRRYSFILKDCTGTRDSKIVYIP